jgi:hypothetical protein
MNYSEVAVVPAAFALLTAIFMFGGRNTRPFNEASHKAAGVLVAFFLISAIVLIAHDFLNRVIAAF